MDLYRGKSVKSGLWFIGAVICLRRKAYILLSESLKAERPSYDGLTMGFQMNVRGLAVDPYAAMEHGWTEALDRYEERMPRWEELKAETVTRCTGKRDKNGSVLFEGDVIEDNTKELCEICYGAYRDQDGIENVGFFRVSLIDPDKEGPLPLGATEEFASLVGNIFDEPGFATPYADQQVFTSAT